MLEIKNLTKIYNTRGGVTTKALDGVSVTFAETGLVFLLGKSGSGKSTLLNVAGGLDEPTEGEVIVKGKSSKDFTGSDFDSYRNTFVGFIFQEYNILDEFNVEDNVALALELQGKNKDKERIDAILRDVELENFAKRKPNTLSGGQKQRIAIARALVKEPQIIMADEPTGALDSATGKQVFDVLKKLSQTRLVIVVSHDREFAEIYGDRIIELKDGKIVSDVTKSQVPPEKLDENVHIIGGNTLSIKSGATLTKSNLAEIQSFIKGAEGDVIITRGGREIENFKKSNRLSDEGGTETFEATGEVATREYAPEQSKFIRSKLPASKAIRIGASSLKLKPIRLVFTIFLAVVAFIMFGLASTMMMYNGNNVMVNSFVNSGVEHIDLTKYSESRSYDDGEISYINYTAQRFSEDELSGYKKQYGAGSFGYRSGKATLENVVVNEKKSAYYFAEINKFAVVDSDNPLRKSKLYGSYPEARNEICISDYLFSAIANGTFNAVTLNKDGTGEVVKETESVKTYGDIIGKYILTRESEQPLKVTGVFQSGEIPEKFDKLLTDKTTDYSLQYNLKNYLSEGLFQTALVTREFYVQFNAFFGNKFEEAPNVFKTIGGNGSFDLGYLTDNGEGTKPSLTVFYSSGKLEEFGCEKQLKTYMFGGRTALADDELIIGLDHLRRQYLLEDVAEYYTSVSVENAAAEFGEFKKNLIIYLDGYYVAELPDGYSETVWCDNAERKQALEKVVEELAKMPPLRVQLFTGGESFDMKIAGFFVYDKPQQLGFGSEGAYFTADFIKNGISPSILISASEKEIFETNYVEKENEIYDGVMVAFDGAAASIRSLLGIVGEENKTADDAVFNINSSIYDSVLVANQMVDVLSLMFLIIGIVLAVFASLLLFNFISVSISNKRKEIGILRAVGARGVDVFKIFFAESGIIVGICTVLALIGTAVLCSVINGIIIRDLGIMVTLFVFGAGPVAVLVAVAAFVAFISTFLPVYLAARKKPVESIRAL